MTATLSRTGLAAWRSFLEAHAAVTSVLERELVAQRELPLAWYDVLVQLSEAPNGRLRMQDLAAKVLLSKSGLTRLCDRMEAAGLRAVRARAGRPWRRGTQSPRRIRARVTSAAGAGIHTPAFASTTTDTPRAGTRPSRFWYECGRLPGKASTSPASSA